MRRFSPKRTYGLFATLVALVLGLMFISNGVQADRPYDEVVSLSELTRPELNSAKLIAPLNREAELDLTLALALPDRAALDAFIGELHDERSPQYHRWITPREFGDRFGVSRADYQDMVEWLRAQGFKIKETWPNRLAIDFSGRVSQIEATFRTEINSYELQGKRYFSHNRAPKVPARFAHKVLNILGLENFSEPQPMVVRLADGAQANGQISKGGADAKGFGADLRVNGSTALGPKDLYAAYNINPLLTAGIDGKGMNIAIAARTDFNLSDVQKFRTTAGLPANDPVKVFPMGSVANLGGIEETEVLLDAQLAGAAAPAATVQVIIAPKISQSIELIYNKFASIPIVNISFGLCEEKLLAENVKFFDALYAQGVTQGQTTFVSAGDDGVDDCRNGKQGVNGLASSPSATAVGGTRLDAKFDGNGNSAGYGGEQVWNSGRSTGGGASAMFSKPSFQFGPGVPADGKRDLPDIALLADPGGPGFFIVQGGNTIVIGGTSASSPCWAGMLALVEQFNGAVGFGNINFRLYALGGNQFNGGPTVYNDVTFGNNNSATGVTGFSAQASYDLVTGWGSINADAFARNYFTQQNSLKPVRNLRTSTDNTGVVLNWQEPEMMPVEPSLTMPGFNVIDLNREARNSFQMPTYDLLTGEQLVKNFRFGVIKADRFDQSNSEGDSNIGTLPTPSATGQPPEITNLTVRLKGKNKAIADFTVSDPDANLGSKSAVSIILFDRSFAALAAARGGNLLPFSDKSVFSKPIDFTGQTSGTFPFTLKGIKTLPTASIWVSSLRDDTGNLALSPGVAGIAGRVTSAGQTPQINNTFSALLENEDAVGLNLDGSDMDANTVALSMAFLDASGNVSFALGILGDDGFENFAPIPLTKVNNPVSGQVNFMVSILIKGITAQVKPGTLKSVAVSLVDSNGNRSPVKIVPFTSDQPTNGLLRYNIYRSKTSPVVLTPNNLIGSVAGNSTTFNDKKVPGADGSTKFFYVVTAVYARGESPASNEVTATPPK